MKVYDSLNQNTQWYSIEEIDGVCLDTSKAASGRYHSGKWYSRMKFTFKDGESCAFSVRALGEDWTEALQIAQDLKAQYGTRVSIKGTENLWKVVLDTTMSAGEEKQLYALYETEK